MSEENKNKDTKKPVRDLPMRDNGSCEAIFLKKNRGYTIYDEHTEKEFA